MKMTRLGTLASLFPLLLSVSTASPPKTFQLDNGLDVILKPLPAAEKVAVVLLFDVGADHDPPGKSGRAHLLEHVYCTAAAGDNPVRDFRQIQRRYGMGYNQQTGSDFTVFAGVVGPDQLEEELEDTAARMRDLRLNKADLEREVPRIEHELTNMFGGMPNLAGVNHVRKHLFPIPKNGQPGGNPEHVRRLSLEELQQDWKLHYKPTNATLVLAGSIEIGASRMLVDKHFGAIPSGKAPAAPTPKDKRGAKSPETRTITVNPIIPNATGLAAVGFAAPLPSHKDYAPFLLVVSRLRAASQMIPKQGQPLPLFYPPIDDPSTIVLQEPIAADGKPDDALKKIELRLKSALEEKPSTLDKQRTIQSMAMLGTAEMPDAMWSQNVYGLAFSLGRRHQLKIDGKKLRNEIQRVTDRDLKRLAKSTFAPKNRETVVISVK